MICQNCQSDVPQIVYCDCFAVLCHDCFGAHHCGREHLARYTGGGGIQISEFESPQQLHDPTELAAAAFRLRPYQQRCVEAILEALQ
jgi:hypothetical protein